MYDYSGHIIRFQKEDLYKEIRSKLMCNQKTFNSGIICYKNNVQNSNNKNK
jgi:hypothetical protein